LPILQWHKVQGSRREEKIHFELKSLFIY